MAKTKARKRMAKAKKRNPPDATLRNVRAANKRFELLEDQIGNLAQQLVELKARVNQLDGGSITPGSEG